MLIKTFKTEHYQDYKYPCMFIASPNCTFKCDKESGKKLCQNSHLANENNIEVSDDYLIQLYKKNPITKAIVFGGLEPFDSIEDVLNFIKKAREAEIKEEIIIYTGYTEEEILKLFKKEYDILKKFKNIVIKFGRFFPNNTKHYDNILGTYLSSDNQYAKKIE